MLSISKPCNEDWAKMLPTEQGAFCNNCQKQVVDFTLLTDDEVLQFLNKNIGKKLCGRASTKQLNKLKIEINKNIIYTNISKWKKYLAILLICFGSTLLSCTNKGKVSAIEDRVRIKGEIEVKEVNFGNVGTIKNDYINKPLKYFKEVIGQFKLMPLSKLKTDTITETYITGEIYLPPEPPDATQPSQPLPKISDKYNNGKAFKKDSTVKEIDTCTTNFNI